MSLATAMATAGRPPGNRSGYLCLPQPDLAGSPRRACSVRAMVAARWRW